MLKKYKKTNVQKTIHHISLGRSLAFVHYSAHVHLENPLKLSFIIYSVLIRPCHIDVAHSSLTLISLCLTGLLNFCQRTECVH